MNISKKSWHYRLVGKVGQVGPGVMPKTLCSYFWALMICLMVCVLMVIISPIYAIAWVVVKVSEIKYWKDRKKKKENKEPGLVVSYFKAKKRKICPLIDYVE